MSKTTAHTVDGIPVRLDYVRTCRCGKRPLITTGYAQFDDGNGPFFIQCDHEDKTKHPFDVKVAIFVRSWSKTRVVRLWNQMVRNQIARLGKVA